MPRNRVHLTADVAADPDAVFTFLTDHFDELWPGRMERVKEAPASSESRGLGFVRRIILPTGSLDEEIVAHERPHLIEYEVIGDDAPIHNHLGHIELAPSGSGTRIDYTVAFDYRPAWQGPGTAAFMRAWWALRSRRRLRREFPG